MKKINEITTRVGELIHKAYKEGYRQGMTDAVEAQYDGTTPIKENNRKPRIGVLIEVRMPSGKTERLRVVDKDISEIGEDECSLYSTAVARGRVVEEDEE